MEIKKTKCAEEIPYIEVGEFTIYGADANNEFTIECEVEDDFDRLLGSSVSINRRQMKEVVNFLQNELDKES